MTAEVVILNKNGVALAADSAVTTGMKGKERIYNTSNKIFMLSKYEPIGIMISNSVEYMGYPWETIIKIYRKNLEKKQFASLSEYKNNLLDFLTSKKFISEKEEEMSVAFNAMQAMEILKMLADKKHQGQRKYDVSIFNRVAEDLLDYIQSRPILSQFSSITNRAFLQKYSNIFDVVIELVFNNPRLPRRCSKIVREISYHACISDHHSKRDTGIVIVGFGEDDWLPSMESANICGCFFGKLKAVSDDSVNISRTHRAGSVYAFAQKRMVGRFMEGVDRDYQTFIEKYFETTVRNFAEEIIREHGTLEEAETKIVKNLVNQKIKNVLTDFEKASKEFQYDRFTDPVITVVDTMPKEELAALAESLVSLSSLERRVSGERETVGGPIDVAVISKGDGFVWIKRKHYFSLDYNQHFMRTYFNKDLRE